MVLVGHSMGGLLCKMVAVDSGDRLWRITSDRPVGELTGEVRDIELMRDCLIFGAYPGVRRVVYIATPHRGSQLDRGSFRAIGTRLVFLPDALRAAHHRLVAKNPPGLLPRAVPPGPAEQHRRAGVGLADPDGPLGTGPPAGPESPYDHRGPPRAHRPGSQTDGLVSYESAHVAGAASEKLVSAGHLCQDHPEVIGEVRRILLEHLHP